jgi:hypothetical protein
MSTVVKLLRSIAIYLLIAICIFSIPAYAGDVKMTWHLELIDRNTKEAVEGASVHGRFLDVNSGNTSEEICITDNKGICKLNAVATGKGFFTDAMVKPTITPSKEGYSKNVTFAVKYIDENNSNVIVYLTKNSESKYTIKYYDRLFNVKDDDLEYQASIDTHPAHKTKNFGETVNFLRVFIDKKSGKSKYQVYVLLSYYNNGFHNYDSGAASSPDGPVPISVKKIDSQVNCSNKNILNDKQCGYQETVLIELDETFLRKLVENFQTEVPVDWKFRLKAHSGTDSTLSLPYAEIAALLARVDQYSSRINK